MLTQHEFAEYARALHLSPAALDLISSVRGVGDNSPAPPVRRIESHTGNSNVRYPSLKMGFVVECESGRAEYYAALHFEHHNDVLEYYTQPAQLTLHYPSRFGRPLKVPHTPDFLVLRTRVAEFVECKTVNGLAKLLDSQPGRYSIADSGWECPPGLAAARERGVGYRVWTPAELLPEFVANLRYLDPIYRCSGPQAYSATEFRCVLDYVESHQGILLEKLEENFRSNGPALIRWLLAFRHLHFDMSRDRLSEPHTVHIYTSPDLVRAAAVFAATKRPLPLAQSDSPLAAAYRQFGKSAFAIANRRMAVLSGSPDAFSRPHPRTVRSWKKLHDKAERLYGLGFLGLLDRSARRGNRVPRYPQNVTALADQVIREYYVTRAGMSGKAAYKIYCSRCAEQQIVRFLSYVSFWHRINALDPAEVKVAREGPRAAYPLLGGPNGQVGALDVHGDYPLGVVHIDHTQLDVEAIASHLVAGKPYNLGRPWLTIAFDACSRFVLSFYLSFDSPSVESVLMVIRDCVFRHELLPMGLTVDNGPEFHSVWFETFTAVNKTLVWRRPPRHARFGALVENCFGIANEQLIHTLEGNTQLMKNVRQTTKSFNPAGHAIWTLVALYQLLDEYFFQHFNTRPHADLGQSPAEAFPAMLRKHGIDQLRHQEFNSDFLMSTLVDVSHETLRVQPARGVKVRGDYFYHPDLARMIGKDVPVRYDPMDPGRVFAFVSGKWVPCQSKYASRVAGLTVRQVECWAQDLRQRHAGTKASATYSAQRLGTFIDKLKRETEGKLRLDLERALANREVLGLRDGFLLPGTPISVRAGQDENRFSGAPPIWQLAPAAQLEAFPISTLNEPL